MNRDQITREHFLNSILEEIQLTNDEELLKKLEWIKNYIEELEGEIERNKILASQETINKIQKYE